MEKLVRIVFYKDQFGIKKAFNSKILFRNETNAKVIADKIAKEVNVYWKLEELYI